MTTNLIEAAQRALEALNCHAGNYKLTKSECKELNRVTDELTAAIEAAKSEEPVAVAWADNDDIVEKREQLYCCSDDYKKCSPNTLRYDTPLYLAPLAQPVAVPDGWKLVPLELLQAASDSLGSFVSDHGWSQHDMDVMDSIDALLPRPAAPEAQT